MVERKEKVPLMSEEEILLENNKELEQVERILSEATNYGVDVSKLKYRVRRSFDGGNDSDDIYGGFFSEHDNMIQKIRRSARGAILVANGADAAAAGPWSWDHQDQKENSGIIRNSTFFVVWKNLFGKTVAVGERDYLINNPIIQKFNSLCQTRRGWQSVECWNLGCPGLYLDKTFPHYKDIWPENLTFLFSDEVEQLKTKGSLVTYYYHSIYQEAAEAYFIDGDVEGGKILLSSDDQRRPILLYKVRATLMD